MTADQLVQFVTQALFALIFLITAASAIRRPLRSNIDVAALFGVATVLVAETWLVEALHAHPGRLLTAITGVLVVGMPYPLVLLVDDFMGAPRPIMRGATAGLVAAVMSLLLLAPPYPLALDIAYILYFVGCTLYAAVAFVRAARSAQGVTRRRMQAASLGCIFLGLAILWDGVQAALPRSAAWSGLSDAFALISAVCYFVGFATPRWLRRTWQEPAVRAFLDRATALSRLPHLDEVVRALEEGLAIAFGARRAAIGLYEQASQTLRYRAGDSTFVAPTGELIAGRAFAAQAPVFSADAARDDPAHADIYRRSGAHAVLAAPLTAGERRFGALALFAPRMPLFAEDDLDLVSLLAAQCAVILENHLLISEAATVRAREEATRLRDDFLAAAAHDLKTPLTALVAQTQLLAKRARRTPSAPADLDGIERIERETQRLKRLVLELLDVSRIQQGRIVIRRAQVDLARLLREACERHATPLHRCILERAAPIVGALDEQRIMQLIENLIENAVKYSPGGGEIRVALWQEAGTAHITVTDPGIGIPEEDMPHLFDRFHRGSNVDDSEAPGLGLGLFICRAIVEQHGGSLSAASPGPGLGSTFHATLPLGAPAVEPSRASATAGEEVPHAPEPAVQPGVVLSDAAPAGGGGAAIAAAGETL